MGLTITRARMFRPLSIASRSSVRRPNGAGSVIVAALVDPSVAVGAAGFCAVSALVDGLVDSGACFLLHPTRRNAVADKRHTTALQFLKWLFTYLPALYSAYCL